MDKRIGAYSFIVGIVLAIILGLFAAQIKPVSAILISVLIVLGIIVGFLNVAGKETKEFLIVGAVLAIVVYVGGAEAGLAQIMYVGTYIAGILNHIMAFLLPAIIVVALKDVYRLAKQP